ncbi:MAG: helix-turn-helix transcriptional regulator [Leptolyngbya sp. UWPOB_LEPTO1]|uniref:helix-turn-helix transcriptional regulator n=1 Tax=Leptolyngbya sp. UWPOB_LEPTO1 TaxID=2815653 RepID=UPI001AC1303D|nr:helix-turn-helix transcriptional regulator [Leptolyngbya sp. UWPOB_LEPTO1]MBN8561079.1 helix-turn-helix transcriptional regulator [Leptolyngbya sp. UWPOB_LEPTO1]
MNQNRRAISKIAQLREEAELTQLELSRLVGVTENTIQNWEKGRSGLEHIERVIKLCEALDCSPAELIGYELVESTEDKEMSPKRKLQKIRRSLGTDNQPVDEESHRLEQR